MINNIGKTLDVSIINPSSYQLIPLLKILLNKKGGLLICDGVGVGKTISAGYIIIYSTILFNKPSIVVASPIMVNKWILELRYKFNINTYPIRNTQELETASEEMKYYNINDPRCYIISRSLFQTKEELHFSSDSFSAIIIDEIHNFRNNRTCSYKNMYSLARNAVWKIGLSATPINNNINDLSNEFSLLFQQYSLDSWSFTVNEIFFKKEFNLLNSIITRFKKEDLGIHFAKRNIIIKDIHYDSQYFIEVDKVIYEKLGKVRRKGYPIDLITYYRLASSCPKAFLKSIGQSNNEQITQLVDNKIMQLKEMLQGSNINKWIIFCEFEETTKYILNNLNSTDYILFTITGQTSINERIAILSQFKEIEKAVIILTSVGTEGIDLQFCSALINYDLNWNPMIIEQRIGRIDRIGQLNKEILIYNFYVKNSIDDNIISTLRNKLKVIGEVFGIEENVIGNQITDESKWTHQYQQILKDEIKTAEHLVKSYNINKFLISEDYHILPFINKNYCFPNILKNDIHRKDLELLLLNHNNDTSAWKNEFNTNVVKLFQILAEYK